MTATIAKSFDAATNADGKNIFFFWDDPKTLPEPYLENIDAIRALHPDWSVQLASDAIIQELLALDHPEIAAAYSDIRVPACRSDIGRLLLLHRYGGWYLDSDMQCRESLEIFGTSHPIVIRRDDTENMRARFRIMNGIMFMPKGHALPGEMLGRVDDNIRDRAHLHDVLAFAGPKLLSAMVRKFGFGDDEVLSYESYLGAEDAFFKELSSASSFSWRMQQCFGILPVEKPNWEIFPPRLRIPWVQVIRNYVTAHNVEHWVIELAQHRPNYLERGKFRALLRQCEAKVKETT